MVWIGVTVIVGVLLGMLIAAWLASGDSTPSKRKRIGALEGLGAPWADDVEPWDDEPPAGEAG
jgi:hypothetical protein